MPGFIPSNALHLKHGTNAKQVSNHDLGPVGAFSLSQLLVSDIGLTKWRMISGTSNPFFRTASSTRILPTNPIYQSQETHAGETVQV